MKKNFPYTENAPTCDVCGCKFHASYIIRQHWGKEDTFFASCKAHAPQWIVQGMKESPKTTIFGITKSWYSLEYSI